MNDSKNPTLDLFTDLEIPKAQEVPNQIKENNAKVEKPIKVAKAVKLKNGKDKKRNKGDRAQLSVVKEAIAKLLPEDLLSALAMQLNLLPKETHAILFKPNFAKWKHRLILTFRRYK